MYRALSHVFFTKFVYCSLLSTFVAVALSSDNLLLITLNHAASTSLSVCAFPRIVLSQRSVQMRYADSDMTIFSKRVAPESWTLVHCTCPVVLSVFFCSVLMVSVLHSMIVPSDIFGQVFSPCGHKVFAFSQIKVLVECSHSVSIWSIDLSLLHSWQKHLSSSVGILSQYLPILCEPWSAL